MSKDNELLESTRRKVQEIFHTAFNDRSARVFAAQNVGETMHVVKEAFAAELDSTKVEQLSFNMADWGSDAAFVVALHLFPERFTPEEIRATTFHLALHLSYHVKNVADALGVSEENDAIEEPDDTQGAKPRSKENE